MTTELLLEKVINAHGGLEAWQNISEITYEKTSVLLDSLGNTESSITKTYRTVFTPEFLTEMQWEIDSTSYHAILKDDELVVSMPDSITPDQTVQETYKKELLGAHYVYWQPYNLLEEDAVKKYTGVESLENEDTHVLKVTYPNSSNNNIWWYFFDKETYLVRATMVQHGNTYSLIENNVYETKSGLSLNLDRSSYRINKARKKQFLRAQYVYKLLDIQHK